MKLERFGGKTMSSWPGLQWANLGGFSFYPSFGTKSHKILTSQFLSPLGYKAPQILQKSS